MTDRMQPLFYAPGLLTPNFYVLSPGELDLAFMLQQFTDCYALSPDSSYLIENHFRHLPTSPIYLFTYLLFLHITFCISVQLVRSHAHTPSLIKVGARGSGLRISATFP